MGAGLSGEGIPLFESIQKWPWSRAAAVLKAYSDEEYDFGIDATTIVSITGLSMDDSKQFIKILSKDKKGLIVNALTMLSAIICLADSSQQILETRAGAIFDLFDFDGTAQITQDETTILLMCVGTAMSCVLKQTDVLQDNIFTSLTSEIYEDREKKSSRVLLRHEFLSWVNKTLFEIPQVSVDTVFRVVYLKDAPVKSLQPSFSFSPKNDPGYEFEEGSRSPFQSPVASGISKDNIPLNKINSADEEKVEEDAKSARSESKIVEKAPEDDEKTDILPADEPDEYEESFEKDESDDIKLNTKSMSEEKSPRNDSKSPRVSSSPRPSAKESASKDMEEKVTSAVEEQKSSPRLIAKESASKDMEEKVTSAAEEQKSSPRPSAKESASKDMEEKVISPRPVAESKISPRTTTSPRSEKCSPRGGQSPSDVQDSTEIAEIKSTPRVSPRSGLLMFTKLTLRDLPEDDKNDIFIQFIQNKEIIYQTSKNFNEESYNFELKISVTNQETLQDHPIQLQLMKEKADIDLIGKIILNCDDIIQGNGENIQISGKFSNESDEIVGEFSLEGTYQA